ncbi:MAG: tetratricopeptide repeat protein, partial [Mameliella sp.]|nr:tetratricopeptide repeat protein [Phaeodactylibacter sp.]
MAKRLHLIIWVCCCFLAQPHLSCQNQLLDSLLHLVEQGQPDTLQARYLARISDYYLRRDLDKAIEYAEQTLVVARQTGQQHLVSRALINKCIAYQDKGVFDSVQLIASQAELHFQRHPNVIELSNLYSTRGHLERLLGRNDKAFDWYIKAVKNLEENFEDSTDFNAMPAYLNNVAISLNGKGAYKEAFAYLEQALA